MNSRTILASIVVSVLLVSFTDSKVSAQGFSVEKTVQKRVWLGRKYILAEGSSFSIGDVLTRGETVSKYPENCFAGVQTTKYDDAAAEEKYKVWKPGLISRLIASIQGIKIQVSVPATEGGKPGPVEPNVEVILKPSDLADNVTAFVSFRGRREEVHPQILNDYAKGSHWSPQCLTILRSRNSYVIADIIHGFVSIRFAQQIHGEFTPIDLAMPSWWRQVKVGQFEKEATLIVARRPKLKRKSSTVIGMEVKGYLRHL